LEVSLGRWLDHFGGGVGGPDRQIAEPMQPAFVVAAVVTTLRTGPLLDVVMRATTIRAGDPILVRVCSLFQVMS
jgi:hypothetical protein